MSASPPPIVSSVRGVNDQLVTVIIHAAVVALVVIATVILAALRDIDQATTAAILGTSLGYTGGTSAARRVADVRSGT